MHTVAVVDNRQFHVVQNEDDLREALHKFATAPLVALDTETTGLDIFADDFDVVGLVLTVNPDEGYYVPMAHRLPPEIEASNTYPNLDKQLVAEVLHEAFATRQRFELSHPVMHNASFDRLVMLRTMGTPLDLTRAFDTMIASQLIDENQSMSLKALAKRYLTLRDETTEFDWDSDGFDDLLDTFQEEYETKSGRKRKRQAWALKPDWQQVLVNRFLEQDHNGAVSYKYMITLNLKLMGALKRARLIDFKGQYSRGFQDVPVGLAAIYALDDGFNTWELANLYQNTFFPHHEKLDALLHDVQLPVDDVMTRATAKGILVDKVKLRQMQDLMDARIATIQDEAKRIADEFIPIKVTRLADGSHVYEPLLDREVILTSHIQLRTLLFDIMGFPALSFTENGNSSTAKDVLGKLKNQVPKKVKDAEDREKAKRFIELKLQLGELQKLRTTYTESILDKLDSNGRLHAFFNVIGAVSGRMSSSNPNLQNMPRLTPGELEERPWLEGIDIRDALVADPGFVFVSADYDSMEMVATAGMSGDANLIALIEDKRDPHAFTARYAFGVGKELDDTEFKNDPALKVKRQKAKTVNFLMVYGGNEYTIMNKLGVTREEAEQLYAGYFEAFPGVATWMQNVYDTLETDGYIEYPEFGFIKHLDLPPPELEMKDSRAYTSQYKAALRTSQNALIQGWCAMVMKKALVEIDRKLREELCLSRDDASVVLQVHDEAVVLCREEHAQAVGQMMEETMSREFRGVKLHAAPEYRRTLSKSAPAVEFIHEHTSR